MNDIVRNPPWPGPPPENPVDAVARAIWQKLAGLSTDYSEVPFDEILTRPRYQHLRDIVRQAALAAIDAAARA